MAAFALKWTIQVDGAGAPAFFDGMAIVGRPPRAVRLSDQTKVWEVLAPGELLGGKAVVADGIAFLCSDYMPFNPDGDEFSSTLYAVDAREGHVRWSSNQGPGVFEKLTPWNGGLVVVCEKLLVYLDQKGDERIKTRVSDSIWTKLLGMYGDEAIILLESLHRIVGFNLRTQTLRTIYQAAASFSATMLGGHLYLSEHISGTRSSVAKLSLPNAQLIWRRDAQLESVRFDCVGEHLFSWTVFGDINKPDARMALTKRRDDDGAPLWSLDLDGYQSVPPVIVGGRLFAATLKNGGTKIAEIALDTGRVRRRKDYSEGAGWIADHGADLLVGSDAKIDCFATDRLWQTDLNAGAHGAPIARSTMAIVGTIDGRVTALSLTDGSKLWSTPLSAPAGNGFCIDNGALFIGHGSGIAALQPANGSALWTFPTAAAVTSAIISAGGYVIIGGRDQTIHAVNPVDGRQVWAYQGDGYVDGGFAVGANAIYFGSSDGSFRALDFSGALKWSFQTQDEIKGTPALSGDLIIFGDAGGTLTALNRDTGELVWIKSNEGSLAYARPIAAGGLLYIGDESGTVSCRSVGDGELRWRSELIGAIRGATALDGRLLYAATQTGKLATLDTDGAILRLADLPEPVFAPPCVVADAVIVATTRGRVHALLK